MQALTLMAMGATLASAGSLATPVYVAVTAARVLWWTASASVRAVAAGARFVCGATAQPVAADCPADRVLP